MRTEQSGWTKRKAKREGRKGKIVRQDFPHSGLRAPSAPTAGQPRDLSGHPPFDVLYKRATEVADKFGAYSVLKAACDAHDFRHFALMIFPPEHQETYAEAIYISNNPEEFIAEYDRDKHLANNIALFPLRHSVVPIVWDVRKVKLDRRKASRASTLELLARYGKYMGVNFALYDSRGNQGALSFTGDRPAPDATELAQLNLISTVVFDRLDVQPNIREPGMNFRLAERERQVLKWASAGKTSSQIATALSLSEHTVNQYIASCIDKLGVVNRVHAVARAIRLGLIE